MQRFQHYLFFFIQEHVDPSYLGQHIYCMFEESEASEWSMIIWLTSALHYNVTFQELFLYAYSLSTEMPLCKILPQNACFVSAAAYREMHPPRHGSHGLYALPLEYWLPTRYRTNKPDAYWLGDSEQAACFSPHWEIDMTTGLILPQEVKTKTTSVNIKSKGLTQMV